jgi:hypothetical protein
LYPSGDPRRQAHSFPCARSTLLWPPVVREPPRSVAPRHLRPRTGCRASAFAVSQGERLCPTTRRSRRTLRTTSGITRRASLESLPKSGRIVLRKNKPKERAAA